MRFFICHHWSKWAKHSKFGWKVCYCQYCKCLTITLFDRRLAFYLRDNE